MTEQAGMERENRPLEGQLSMEKTEAQTMEQTERTPELIAVEISASFSERQKISR